MPVHSSRDEGPKTLNTAYYSGKQITSDKPLPVRDPNDFYPTEEACVRAYFNQFPPILEPRSMLDPAAGTGVWGKVVREMTPSLSYVAGIELQKIMPSPDARSSYDMWVNNTDFIHGMAAWTTRESHELHTFDLVATNPPFKHAEEFLERSAQVVTPNGCIVFLLRLGFLASERRYKLWSSGLAPTDVTILNTRPSFTGDGKTYPGDFAVFRWRFCDGVCINTPSVLQYMTYKRD